jgi:hypothetical protein
MARRRSRGCARTQVRFGSKCRGRMDHHHHYHHHHHSAQIKMVRATATLRRWRYGFELPLPSRSTYTSISVRPHDTTSSKSHLANVSTGHRSFNPRHTSVVSSTQPALALTRDLFPYTQSNTHIVFQCVRHSLRYYVPTPLDPTGQSEAGRFTAFLEDITPPKDVADACVAVIVVNRQGLESTPVLSCFHVAAPKPVERLTRSGFEPFPPTAAGAPPSFGGAFELFVTDELTKVDPVTGRVLTFNGTSTAVVDPRLGNTVWDATHRTVALSAWRGEMVGFQLTVNKMKGVSALHGVTVMLSGPLASQCRLSLKTSLTLQPYPLRLFPTPPACGVATRVHRMWGLYVMPRDHGENRW